MSRAKVLIDLAINGERRALEIAAANPDNWKVIEPKSQPKDWEIAGDIAAEKIDAAIFNLIDLAPERLSWNVLALCEVLITCKTQTKEHLDAVVQLLDMMPVTLRQEASEGIQRLMAAAGRDVISMNPPCCVERPLALRRGWIVV